MAIQKKFDNKNDILNFMSKFERKNTPQNVNNTIKIITSNL